MGKREKVEQAPAQRRMPVGAWMLIAAAVILMMIGGVAAYLSTATDPVKNTFTADSQPTIKIMETMQDNVKSNVYVQVEADYAVYVRAAVVVTWKDVSGNVLGTAPIEGTDYTISYNETDWFYEDGFWYCKAPVNSGGSTAVLINNCAPKDGQTPVNYGLNVEIIAQTIQALGTTDKDNTPAVTNAWGIAVENGQLVAPEQNS